MTVYIDDDARWDAMRARDRAAEGAFYIGVRTTGVYCVASCGGRPCRMAPASAAIFSWGNGRCPASAS